MIDQLLSQRPAESAQTQSRARTVELGAAGSWMRELVRGESGAIEAGEVENRRVVESRSVISPKMHTISLAMGRSSRVERIAAGGARVRVAKKKANSTPATPARYGRSGLVLASRPTNQGHRNDAQQSTPQGPQQSPPHHRAQQRTGDSSRV